MKAAGFFLWLVLFLTGTEAANGQATTRLPFLLGGDLSMVPAIEQAGVQFKNGGRPEDIFAIFRAHGANCVRLRLFVQPDGRAGVINDLPYTLALAKRVKAAGLLLSLDLHYSDTWADPGNQTTPVAWQKLAPAALADQVRAYTAETFRAFAAAGGVPDVVQIGNEIASGLLWPTGRLGGEGPATAAQFDQVAALLKAGVAGVREGIGNGPMPRIMLHIDGGDNLAKAKWFFEGISRRGVPFNVIGLSYYPFYNGTLHDLRQTLDFLARTYGKPVAVVETAYPHAEMPWIKPQDRRGLEFPLTPAGQRDFLRALVQAVRETPGGLGAGVIYWYPESVPVHRPEVNDWHGGDAAMFDREGNALPAFAAFSKP